MGVRLEIEGNGVTVPATYLPRVWMGSKVSEKLLPTRIRPLSAHLKLTENCQARCISCDYWKTRWNDAIDTQRAVDLLNEIGELGIGAVRFTGGEPLLRKDFFEILAKANTKAFKRVIVQTNGLLIKKLHKEINASAITDVAVSIDGLKETNDHIRGIRGYFDLGLEGIRLLEGKNVAISITLNRISVSELEELNRVAQGVGAHLETNILSKSLFFLKDADYDVMWPKRDEVPLITNFVRGTLKRPGYEVDYITKYYNREPLDEPPCVLGFTQVFVMSNGDVLTGCYPLKPVGNILRESLGSILASEACVKQCMAMVRRECPGCTCGVETSLAVQHAVSGALFELKKLTQRENQEQKVHAAAAT